MNSRERTLKTIEFKNPDRIPIYTQFSEDDENNKKCAKKIRSCFPTDILVVSNSNLNYNNELTYKDEWGCSWERLGNTMGEVVENPLKNWINFNLWVKNIPDFREEKRYIQIVDERKNNLDKFVVGSLGLLSGNLMNIRGFENFMTDLYLERDKLNNLIDIIYNAAKDSIDKYSHIGLDAVIAFEDWGLQDRLMIKPDLWREVFKDKMAELISYVHDKNMKFIFHSCGYTLEIIDDFIAIEVDVLQLDQQKNIGLNNLARYTGKICFWCSADIQFTSNNTDMKSIFNYCIEMIEKLSTKSGGFMYQAYLGLETVGKNCAVIIKECEAVTKNNPYQ